MRRESFNRLRAKAFILENKTDFLKMKGTGYFKMNKLHKRKRTRLFYKERYRKLRYSFWMTYTSIKIGMIV